MDASLYCIACGGPLASDYAEADRSGDELCYSCEKQMDAEMRREEHIANRIDGFDRDDLGESPDF